ncbi:hypothetical protein TSUD_209040 [Trifolium subterraneum]|uniref:Uncharacterized protein n=1 Tax=Trifolium subterraneum TaxID=3900 RepID=A0A2Z6MJN5_TRISU|nr:hypothetical protein TSUD_209040 [Trifolium subterraneum]
MLNIFNGSTNFATLLGAFFSDTYFGRYNTLAFCTITSFLGLLGIQFTAVFKNLHPPHCSKESATCKEPTTGQMAFLISAFALLLIGAAGKLYVKVKPSGSPITSIVQVLVASVKKKGLKLPAQHPMLSLFDYVPPKCVNSKLSYTYQFRALDKAAMLTPQDKINQDGSPADPWSLCSIQQVEELKCLIRVLPIWFSAILYHLVIVQQHTLLVFQALQSNRRVGNTNFKIPAASYTVFLMLSMTLWLPIYDRLVVPFLQKFTGKDGGITILQRIGVGMFLALLSILVSAIVEIHRRHLALTSPIGMQPRKGAISSMSGFWLVPQLTLAGLAETFTAVGQIEFYYKQFPENMKSIGGSLFYCGMAGSSYLSAFLVSVVHRTTSDSATGNWLPEDLNKGRLEYFYFMIAGIEVLNFVYFLICSKWYKYRETSSSSSSIGSA